MSNHNQEIRKELDELNKKLNELLKMVQDALIRLKVVERCILILAAHAGAAARKELLGGDEGRR